MPDIERRFLIILCSIVYMSAVRRVATSFVKTTDVPSYRLFVAWGTLNGIVLWILS